MEQNQSNIDDYFRKKLLGYEPTPPERIWNNVKDDLNNASQVPQKHNWIGKYLAIAASVLVVLGVGYLVWSPAPGPSITISAIDSSSVSGTQFVKEEATRQETSAAIAQKLPSQNAAPTPVISRSSIQVVAATDKKKELYLPDSSKVYVNKNSRISYNFNGKREVTVVNGEVYFEVRKQHNKPFLVKSNYSITEVVGTSFMIKSNRAEKKDELYVSSGQVLFKSISLPSHAQLIGPVEKAVLDQNGLLTHSKTMEANYNAWKTEEIIFEDTPLTEVIPTLEHYYQVSLQITNPEILSCHFTGRFEKSSLNEVIQVLAATFNLSFDDKNGMYTLSGKGCN